MDFANEANWLSLYDGLTMAVLTNPIPPIVLSNSLAYRYLRVAANNQGAKSAWRLGAYLSLMVDEPSPQVEVVRWSAPVNIPAILAVPDFLSSYRVRIKAPVWFDEISLQIDGYVGT